MDKTFRTMRHRWREWRTALRAALVETPSPAASRNRHRDGGLIRAVVVPLRVLVAITGDIVQGQLTLRAMSLVYTTLLSLVPLIAISFSVLKGFGVHNRVEPVLLGLLQPLGPEQASEISDRIIGFVDNIQVGVLGFVGLLLLFYTVVSLLEKVERSFNYIWHVPNERPLSQKMRDYLALVVLGPVAVIGVAGATSSLLATSLVQDVAAFGPVGEIMALAGRLVPLFVVGVTFTFIYIFIPNTQVRFGPALLGGLCAAVMWTVIGWGFASFIAGSARYAAIYSAFATLLLFMIWLYLVWLIVLVGNAIAFYVQNPLYIGISRDFTRFSILARENAALTAIWHIVRAWYRDAPAPSADALARRTGIALPLMTEVLEQMVKARLLERVGPDQNCFIPSRPPEETTLDSLRRAVRQVERPAPGESPVLIRPPASVDDHPFPTPVAAVMSRIDRAAASSLAGMTLKDFAMTDDDPADEKRLPKAEEEGTGFGPG